MYFLDVKPEVDKIFEKLLRKDKEQLKTINKKILEVRSNPHHKYKFLKKPLQSFNRIHIGPFVLIFKIDNIRKIVEIYYYDHHDKAYLWKPKK